MSVAKNVDTVYIAGSITIGNKFSAIAIGNDGKLLFATIVAMAIPVCILASTKRLAATVIASMVLICIRANTESFATAIIASMIFICIFVLANGRFGNILAILEGLSAFVARCVIICIAMLADNGSIIRCTACGQ